MPSSDPPIAAAAPGDAPAVAAEPTPSKPSDKESSKDATTTNEPPKLTNAELKKLAKAEKAARRAQAQAAKQPPVSSSPANQPANSDTTSKTLPGQTHSPSTSQKAEDAQDMGKNKNKRGPGSAEVKLPGRGASAPPPVPEQPAKEDKTVEFFRHLNKPRRTTLAGASKDVHPAVQALGLQMSSYTICGSCARLVATLQAFKRVVESYTTPPGNTLTRHLTSHVLSPQIEYLASCRPLSISMGNAIRWLKLQISKVDIDVPDAEAKQGLCEAIDIFIRERITYADSIIAKSTADKIEDGDVIMTYAKSSLVQKALVQAHEDGKKFRVICVDSRPLHEGKHLAEALLGLGLEVKICTISGISHNINDATKILLGAHAMMSNGNLFSRVGTAIVAMEGHFEHVPVIVLCETVKFTERIALDSIVHNEIAPADELVIPGGDLVGWEDLKGLQLCNPMYDVTPAEFLTMIVTETGTVPPTSVPVLHRLGNENH